MRDLHELVTNQENLYNTIKETKLESYIIFFRSKSIFSYYNFIDPDRTFYDLRTYSLCPQTFTNNFNFGFRYLVVLHRGQICQSSIVNKIHWARKPPNQTWLDNFLREINKQGNNPPRFSRVVNYKDTSFSIAGSMIRYNKLSDWWPVIVQIHSYWSVPLEALSAAARMKTVQWRQIRE